MVAASQKHAAIFRGWNCWRKGPAVKMPGKKMIALLTATTLLNRCQR